jgi:hypothetical protein
MYIWTKYKWDTFDTSSYENSTFWGHNVLFFTDDKINALWYGGATDNVRAVNLEMNNPFIIDVEDSIRWDLKNTDNIKSEFNELWNKDYNEFEKKLKKMWDDKISDHIREINPQLQYFWYKLQKNNDWYYDLVSVRHWWGQWDIISYSLETVDELFEYWEINESIPREDDHQITTDDIVKYVLMKNKQWSKYDGIIIENVIDSTNMAWGVANDYIVFDSKQVKPLKWEISWDKN